MSRMTRAVVVDDDLDARTVGPSQRLPRSTPSALGVIIYLISPIFVHMTGNGLHYATAALL
jgi:hypothetical protein